VKQVRDDKLEILIREWATRQAAPDCKLDDLTRQIVERLDVVAGSDDVVTAPHRTAHRMLRWAAVGAAIAASIAVLAYVVQPFVPSVSPDAKDVLLSNRGNGVQRNPGAIGGLELNEKARLVRELQLEFPGRFAWLMETGDEMQLGLSSEERLPPLHFIAIRFVIESQGPDDLDWKPIQALEFVTQPEETVQTSLASNHDATVAIWTYATPDGMISVDSELMFSSPVPVRVSSSRLLSSGAPLEIWQSEQGGVKYRVYQAAEVLESEQLG
jgi:hypothetical protein